MPNKYRPIAILQILYKLFSWMFCNRMEDIIMLHQDVDQAAYRKGFSTEDHLLTLSLLIEKSWEYNFPLWLGLVDFKKAFDTVEHLALWDVLKRQGVPTHYIYLTTIIIQRSARSCTGECAVKKFLDCQRCETRRPYQRFIVLIAVMQDLCGQLKCRWAAANRRRKGIGFGIDFDSDVLGGCLTSLLTFC